MDVGVWDDDEVDDTDDDDDDYDYDWAKGKHWTGIGSKAWAACTVESISNFECWSCRRRRYVESCKKSGLLNHARWKFLASSPTVYEVR